MFDNNFKISFSFLGQNFEEFDKKKIQRMIGSSREERLRISKLGIHGSFNQHTRDKFMHVTIIFSPMQHFR